MMFLGAEKNPPPNVDTGLVNINPRSMGRPANGASAPLERNPVITLSNKWTQLKDHPEQIRAYRSRKRFNIIPAGRRSGKTEIIGKRKMALRCMFAHDVNFPQFYSQFPDPKFFISAPTREQVKRIYWNDMKSLIPKAMLAKPPNESNLIISLINGVELYLLGLDKPERIEGSPWDWGLVDEIANVKPDAWGSNIRPSLSDRRGGCDFIGVPEGRNHFYDMYTKALSTIEADGDESEWGVFHWISADILPYDEIITAQQDLDPLIYAQEYEASFIIFAGMAYYNFDRAAHVSNCRQYYNPNDPLIFTFDFNVAPGTASIIQEMKHWPDGREPKERKSEITGEDDTITSIIGEVHIPRSSNTEVVCRKLVEDWGSHQGQIYCYGDATGGNPGSAKVKGSDWDLIRSHLTRHYGDRVHYKIKTNPRERQRVNAVNSRLKNVLGDIRVQIDGKYAPHVVEDFEGVRILEGSAGEIDKKSTPKLTHLSDGIGYYVHYKYPVRKGQAVSGY